MQVLTGNTPELTEGQQSNEDLIRLYSRQTLDRAQECQTLPKLENPERAATSHSPLCGSVVTVHLSTQGNRISEHSHEVNACSLGTASAAILARQAISMDLESVKSVSKALKNMLKQEGPVPEPPFDILEIMKPAIRFPARHASILLAWQSCLECLKK